MFAFEGKDQRKTQTQMLSVIKALGIVHNTLMESDYEC